MELREWANRILEGDTLEEKLFDPGKWTDHSPGPSKFWSEPSRSGGLKFAPSNREKLPAFQEHGDPYKRAVCLHKFAGHELLAVEIMAFTLLAFPEAPANFRQGLAYTLREEQGHVRLYLAQLERLGVKFGDLPLHKNFWNHTPSIRSPKDYVSIMSLTLEMANLDFAPMYGKSFARFGDVEAAQLMKTILEDEISHVRFGWKWFQKFKGEEEAWVSWEQSLQDTILTPKKAKGFILHSEHRQQAGIPIDWIEKLKKY